MSVTARRNLYPGINAHLHSLLQDEGGWGSFHTRHIVHIADTLAAQLHPLGYTTELEESLQIRRVGDRPTQPQTDVLIYDQLPARPQSPVMQPSALHEEMTVLELFAEDELSEAPYKAIAIYDVKTLSRKQGSPVAWIELLSPSNKGESEDADAYFRD